MPAAKQTQYFFRHLDFLHRHAPGYMRIYPDFAGEGTHAPSPQFVHMMHRHKEVHALPAFLQAQYNVLHVFLRQLHASQVGGASPSLSSFASGFFSRFGLGRIGRLGGGLSSVSQNSSIEYVCSMAARL